MLLVSETVSGQSELTGFAGSIADSAERRRGLRIRQARPVKIFEPSASRYIGGRTEDISSTGLRIELSPGAPVRAGRIVNIHVGVNDRGEMLANRRQMIPARIVWVRRADRRKESEVALGGKMIAGVEFISSIAAHLDAA